MTHHQVTDSSISIGQLLASADPDGVLLEGTDRGMFAVLPVDDDLLDFLVEKSPRFSEECRQIRERMRQEEYQSLDDVKKSLGLD